MKYTKKLALLLTAALLLVAFAGCSEKAPSSSSQQAEVQPEQSEESAEVAEVVEPVTLNFWHHYSAQSAENETLMNVLIPKFEEEQKPVDPDNGDNKPGQDSGNDNDDNQGTDDEVQIGWFERIIKMIVDFFKNLFNSIHRCNVDTLPGFKKDGEMHSFLEKF